MSQCAMEILTELENFAEEPRAIDLLKNTNERLELLEKTVYELANRVTLLSKEVFGNEFYFGGQSKLEGSLVKRLDHFENRLFEVEREVFAKQDDP